MTAIKLQSYDSPQGELLLGSYRGELCLCDWRYRKRRDIIDRRLRRELDADFVHADDDLLRETRNQLEQYFRRERSAFELPLLPVGSEFQKKVWQALLEIPYGRTATYLELARSVGDAKAVRAVAAANGANAISIIVPCHRVIGSDGSLTGYAGGLRAKAELLRIEFDLFSPAGMTA